MEVFMKNIIVITGSPRKKGNSELLAKAFIEGATEAGHKVTLFEAGKKKNKGRYCL
jgi:multimeric flavodoxin WrbA